MGGYDGLNIYETANWSPLKTIQITEAKAWGVSQIAFNSDGTKLAATAATSLKIIDCATWTQEEELNLGASYRPKDIWFEETKLIAGASGGKFFSVWPEVESINGLENFAGSNAQGWVSQDNSMVRLVGHSRSFPEKLALKTKQKVTDMLSGGNFGVVLFQNGSIAYGSLLGDAKQVKTVALTPVLPPVKRLTGPIPSRAPTICTKNKTVLNCKVDLIDVNLLDPRIRVSIAVPEGFPTALEDFSSIVKRCKPQAAINGTYYDTVTLKPIGDVVISGVLRRAGKHGTALAITSDNKASIRRVIENEPMDWTGYETVLGCGPALVLNGKIDVNTEIENFNDDHIMGRNRRMSLGLTGDGRLLLVYTKTPVNFMESAKVMLELGCRDAMNLDAGRSIAMYHSGEFVRPGGPQTNVLTVHVVK